MLWLHATRRTSTWRLWGHRQNLDHLRLDNVCRYRTKSAGNQNIGVSLHPNHDIYVSTSTNPYFNLSLEDWLFRHSPESKPLLLIYRDTPCVVIGRHQNPWTEVNFSALHAANVPFLRRKSGGGTVYHDLGNTNFSIHLPRAVFDRTVTGELVLRAVQSLGIDAHLNDRNDICVGPDKVSGSAYKLVTKRSYHHGTMLLSTQLDALRDLLRPQTKDMVTKGVSSVRSPVCNLQKHANNATHEAFTAAVTAQIRKEYGVTTEPCMVTESLGTTVDYIRHGMEELNTWDWMYGQTPEFVHTLRNCFSWADVVVEIHSKYGLILDVSLRTSNSDLSEYSIQELAQQCRKLYVGKRYGFLQEEKPISGVSSTGLPIQALEEVDIWLRQTTSME